jgi:L-ascorbate metabolism protein UlaG (beta-lactamase superfamily)
MKIQLIRNATMSITYAGRRILTDPMLAPKGAYDPFAGNARNPTVDLPVSPEAVCEGIEAVIVSHYHPDHMDKAAEEILSKGLTVFCQPGDEERLARKGFQSVVPVDASHAWENILITRTDGRHGTGKLGERMGKVSGFVLQSEGEPTVFWPGDTIWCELVEQALRDFEPDIILTHSGGAQFPGSDLIIMDAEQTLTVCRSAPEARVVAIHLEALDHCPVTRAGLRALAEKEGISPERLFIPSDGETLLFQGV